MNWLAFVFVIAGVVLRVAPHPWNFTPVGAIALFGGAHFERRWIAVTLPFATMLIGIGLAEHGGCAVIAAGWIAMALGLFSTTTSLQRAAAPA